MASARCGGRPFISLCVAVQDCLGWQRSATSVGAQKQVTCYSKMSVLDVVARSVECDACHMVMHFFSVWLDSCEIVSLITGVSVSLSSSSPQVPEHGYENF